MVFVGRAESVAHAPELFEQIDSGSRVFHIMMFVLLPRQSVYSPRPPARLP